jgi:quercetin dioxygenase-like cupin family protein
MTDMTVKRTEEFERTFGGPMLKARSGLGVTAFGMQLIELPPNATRYPEHDHAHDGQEEFYTVLDGSATLLAGGEVHPLEPGTFARVGPGEKRKVITDGEPATLLILGGVPGQPFHATQWTDEGEPDPLAAA